MPPKQATPNLYGRIVYSGLLFVHANQVSARLVSHCSGVSSCILGTIPLYLNKREAKAMIDPIGTTPYASDANDIGRAADEEAAQRAKDEGTASNDVRTKAPLPAYQGTTVDSEA
jgi:hypothetical protein